MMSGIFPVKTGKSWVPFGREDVEFVEFATGKGKLAICVISGGWLYDNFFNDRGTEVIFGGFDSCLGGIIIGAGCTAGHDGIDSCVDIDSDTAGEDLSDCSCKQEGS